MLSDDADELYDYIHDLVGEAEESLDNEMLELDVAERGRVVREIDRRLAQVVKSQLQRCVQFATTASLSGETLVSNSRGSRNGHHLEVAFLGSVYEGTARELTKMLIRERSALQHIDGNAFIGDLLATLLLRSLPSAIPTDQLIETVPRLNQIILALRHHEGQSSRAEDQPQETTKQVEDYCSARAHVILKRKLRHYGHWVRRVDLYLLADLARQVEAAIADVILASKAE